jgi:hypothetical protein
MLFIATFETRHFSFEGCGNTEAEALDVLKQGLRAHGAEYRLPKDWWMPDGPRSLGNASREAELELFTVREYERGQAFRDGESI